MNYMYMYMYNWHELQPDVNIRYALHKYFLEEHGIRPNHTIQYVFGNAL